MSDCCSPDLQKNAYPRKHTCPVNGKMYSRVSSTTIKHHIKHSWQWPALEQGYYFCDDPRCAVVYFAQDDSVIEKSQVRTLIGVKERSGEALICYCFGVSIDQARHQQQTRTYIQQETKLKHCACETRNPSGICCLADIKKFVNTPPHH